MGSGGEIRARVFLLWGRRVRAIGRARLAEGSFGVLGGNSRAPARRLRLPAENIDWIIDAQGEFPEGEAAVATLAAGAPGDRQTG